jgi:hypothetical protein
VIRSGETEFRFHREDQPLPEIGRWSGTLDELLLANEAKASRERLTLIRIFEELRGHGYDGSYDAVRRYAKRWAKDRGHPTAAAYVPLSFAPASVVSPAFPNLLLRIPFAIIPAPGLFRQRNPEERLFQGISRS